MDNKELEIMKECINTATNLIEDQKASIKIMESLRTGLQSRLAESEKPKPLEHGDWWLDGKKVKIFMKEYNNPNRDCVALNDFIITNIGSTYQGEPIKGNIFDDLEALGKPIKEFEMECNSASWSGDGKFLHIYENDDACNYILVSRENLSDFILNLRRMEAGLKK
ncbi:MAG: hypothetical protein MUO31_13205 [Thermodesulfovibrionales bacterium]|nr:hypothetical protein [Thermodesulfovibrionales bacterium]